MIMLKCLWPYANKGSGFLLIKLNVHVNASLPFNDASLISIGSLSLSRVYKRKINCCGNDPKAVDWV